MCVCLCVFKCVRLSACVCVCVCMCMCVCASAPVCMCLCMYASVCISIWANPNISSYSSDRLNNKNHNYKTSMAPISSKKSSSVAHLVQGLGKDIVQVRCKVQQQIIRSSGHLGRISNSENMSFQMVTERNYAI